MERVADSSALVCDEFTLPPMLKEVLNTLGIHGIVQQHFDVDGEGDGGLGLASSTLDSEEGVVTLADTSREKMPRFEVILAVLRRATRRARRAKTRDPSPDKTRSSRAQTGGVPSELMVEEDSEGETKGSAPILEAEANGSLTSDYA